MQAEADSAQHRSGGRVAPVAEPIVAARRPDALVALAGVAVPLAIDGRYHLLLRSFVRLRRSRRGRWGLGLGYGLLAGALGVLAARHFAHSGWPLAGGRPGWLIGAGVLLLVAQALKALGWGRLFGPGERPSPLALAAGNGGAALVGVVLPGRFDDAMRIAVVRRYPGCPAGVNRTMRRLRDTIVELGYREPADRPSARVLDGKAP